MLVIEKTKLKEILDTLSKEYQVMVPATYDDTTGFVAYGDNIEILLDHNVLQSPKKMFFPQTENLYRFKSVKNTVEIHKIPPGQEKILFFGVRSCDLKSLECLDQVFLTKGYGDQFYEQKRKNTAIIALSCRQPEDTCFCASMGVDPMKAVGADVQAYDLDETLGFEAVSEKGQNVLSVIKDLLKAGQGDGSLVPTAGQGDAGQGDGSSVPILANDFYLKPDVSALPEKLKGLFDAPFWEEISAKCLNCGACTYLCPTCHCFDISQEVRGEEGTKFRCWDSCMFGEYTQMAGGHNPRPSKKERVRNRFMHKLSYFPERYGMLLCTGCGRCINVCPVNMDITSVITRIKEVQ